MKPIVSKGMRYDHSAASYDDLYTSVKDYPDEAAKVHGLIQRCCTSGGNELLDVACGTGLHDFTLKQWYAVSGIDLTPQMLKIARTRNPGIRYRQGDMRDFRLKQEFDAVICMFSAVGHLRSVPELDRATARMASHLKPGGVLIIQPWLFPEVYRSGRLSADFVDKPQELGIARMVVAKKRGRRAILDMHHMVGTPKGIKHFVEHLELMLFTRSEYEEAFRKAGPTMHYDTETFDGPRGLFVGKKT